MQRRLLAAALPGWFAVFLTLTVHGQTPQPNVRPAVEPVFGKDFVNGKLTAVAEREFTIEYTWQKQLVNQEAAERLAQLQQEYNDAMNLPDPAQRLVRLQQIVAEAREKQKVLYSLEMRTDQQLFLFDDTLKVRLPKLPETDAQGKPIRRTDQELRKLKGPGNLPGWTGTIDDLKVGQLVKVHFLKKRGSPNPFVENPADLYSFVATMVVIQPPAAAKQD
jgi:hypothetical protein